MFPLVNFHFSLFMIIVIVVVVALQPTLSSGRLSQVDAHPLDSVVAAHLSDIHLPHENFRRTLLPPLLQPRAPDTPGHARVRQYIVDYFHNRTSWRTRVHSFDASTPHGTKRFHNLIFTRQLGGRRSHAPRGRYGQRRKTMVLAAHYDSKVEPEGFIGATDSAVPCAMLLELARLIDVLDERLGTRDDGFDVRLVFFDGEEAFVEWSDADSLYGARKLAHDWEQTCPADGVNVADLADGVEDNAHSPEPFEHHDQPQTCSALLADDRVTISSENGDSLLSRIDLFLLLDLLAARKPRVQFHDYFAHTSPAYHRLRSIETRLLHARHLRRSKFAPSYFPLRHRGEDPYPDFHAMAARGDPRASVGVDDDHVPFLKRGVPVLHLIPLPFPDVWHTLGDRVDAVDFDAVQDILMMVSVLVAQVVVR